MMWTRTVSRMAGLTLLMAALASCDYSEELSTATEAVDRQIDAGDAQVRGDLEEQIAQLITDNAALQERVTRLEAEIGGTAGDAPEDGLTDSVVDGLRADLDGVAAEVADLETDLEGVVSDLGGVMSEVETARGTNTSLGDRIDALEANQTVGLDARVGALETEVGGGLPGFTNSRIDANESGVGALEVAIGMPYSGLPLSQRTDGLESEVGGSPPGFATSRIDANETAALSQAADILELEDAVGMPYSDASSLSARATGLETGVADNAADILTNAGLIGDNASDIGVNTSDIASNGLDIASNAADISTLESAVGIPYGAATPLDGRVSSVETTLAPVSVVGDDWILESVNLHVRNGSGATDLDNGFAPGTGNLVIGYDESGSADSSGVFVAGAGDVKSGYHNVVIGQGHQYYSYGAVISGLDHEVGGPNACVLGGRESTAYGVRSVVVGGWAGLTAIEGQDGVILGGTGLTADVSQEVSSATRVPSEVLFTTASTTGNPTGASTNNQKYSGFQAWAESNGCSGYRICTADEIVGFLSEGNGLPDPDGLGEPVWLRHGPNNDPTTANCNDWGSSSSASTAPVIAWASANPTKPRLGYASCDQSLRVACCR